METNMETVNQLLSYNHDADTIIEAEEYMLNRARQLLRLDYKLVERTKHTWGLNYFFVKDKKFYQSIFILKSHRNKGLYQTLVRYPILTSHQCNIADYLTEHKIDHVVEELQPFNEYTLISNYYGDARTKRSGIRYMNHIDEGLAILKWIGASEKAMKAYCVHPIYQGDSDLAYNHDKYVIDSDIMMLAMEYRSVANEYLSQRQIKSISEIRLSPLKDVNDMLIADKIQNRKDFNLYHKGKHGRSDMLTEYFDNWLTKLNVSDLANTLSSKLL